MLRPGEYAQDIFTVQAAYLQGRPPKSVNMYWRRFATSSIPVNDPVAFEIWLRARWMEKDRLLDIFVQTGHFPADMAKGGSGYTETQVKAFRWYEFLQIFAPVGLFALVLYSFYGQLPKSFLASINKQITVAKDTAIQALKGPELQNRILARGPRMINHTSIVANQVARLQNSGPKANGKCKGHLQATKIKALPSSVTTTPPKVSSRKAGVKSPPAGSTKGKRIVLQSPTVNTKALSSTEKQTVARSAQINSSLQSKMNSNPPKLKLASTSNVRATKQG